jgi:hypothetical protein
VQRFFGGILSEWMAMPMGDLVMMAREAEALDARERLDRIVDGQIAAGLAKKGPARSHLKTLRERAGFDKPDAPVTEQMRSAGIEIVCVERTADG